MNEAEEQWYQNNLNIVDDVIHAILATFPNATKDALYQAGYAELNRLAGSHDDSKSNTRMWDCIFRAVIAVEHRATKKHARSSSPANDAPLNEAQEQWYQDHLYVVDDVVNQFLTSPEAAKYHATREEFHNAGKTALERLAHQYDPTVHYPYEVLFSKIHLRMFDAEKTANMQDDVEYSKYPVFLNKVQEKWYKNNHDIIEKIVREYLGDKDENECYAAKDDFYAAAEKMLAKIASLYDPAMNLPEENIRKTLEMCIRGAVHMTEKKARQMECPNVPFDHIFIMTPSKKKKS